MKRHINNFLVLSVIFCSLFLFFELPIDHLARFLLSRVISIDLGGGECEWTPPNYEPDSDTEFFKTLVIGYPGVAKRIVYAQMEALAGLATNDEWPYTEPIEDRPNRPFMKANYPHHEGYWSWEDDMDQSILVLRNPRYAIKEYHAIRWDIKFADKYEDALDNIDSLYVSRSSVEEYEAWREERTLREITWYGWLIDYWMEGGLMRDHMSHKFTTAEHFSYMLNPATYGDDGSLFIQFVGDAEVSPTYDDHCTFDMNELCQPVQIISVERLLDPYTGPNETAKIAGAIQGKEGINVIGEEAWPCIWEELIVNGKGPKIMTDRVGPHPEEAYNFTDEQLVHMLTELRRLKDKYDAPEWSFKKVARDLVEILGEYITDVSDAIKEH